MRILLLCLSLVASVISGTAQTIVDNIIVTEEYSVYNLREKDGRLSSVKNINTRKFLAQRADDSALAVTFYNSDIVVDKASAPGARPQYRAWEDRDMFYDGARVCFMNIPLKQGREAKAVVERTYKAPEQFSEILLTSPYYTARAVYEINVPAALASVVKIHPMRLPDGVELRREENGGGVCYTVEFSMRDGYSRQPLAPASSISSPKLVVTGLFNDVGELYSFMRGTIVPDSDTRDLDAMAEQLTAECSDDFDRMHTIASWVRQNIRYVAVEHGEYAFRPDQASEVFRKRYGDCKGSANLIKAMLRAVGIDGRLVWIGTSGHVDTEWTTIPALSSGNHMIAAAVLPDTTVYLDGTASYCPRGYCPPSITGREVLIEDGDNYIVTRIPENPSGSDRYIFRADYRINGNALEGRMEHELNGVYRMSFVSSYNSRDAGRRLEYVRNYIAPEKRIVECNDIVVNDPQPDAQVTYLTATVSEPKTVTTVGDKMYVDIRPLRNMMFRPVSMKNRRSGVRLSFQHNMVAEITIQLPDGYAMSPSVEPVNVDTPWFRGFIRYIEADGKLTCRADIKVLETDITLDKLPEWNTALKEILASSNTQLTLIKTQ